MSCFRTQETSITDKECLVDGLKELGFKPQVSDTAQRVRGDASETRNAEIICKRENTGYSTDIGFTKAKNGTYSVVADTYVLKNTTIEKVVEKVTVGYAIAKAKKVARDNNMEFMGIQTVTRDKVVYQRLQFQRLGQ